MPSLRILRIVMSVLVLAYGTNCGLAQDNQTAQGNAGAAKADEKKLELATFGAGCFWCVEAVFERIDGVIKVESGYAGGRTANPTYKQVCSGFTGHAEVCQIHFDPKKISYEKLLEVFWQTHDPTTLNRQGPDFGSQYRSVIFYHNLEQKKLALKYKRRLDESGAFPSKIVTEIERAPKYYPAEEYHQDYFRNKPGDQYCALYLPPKFEKLKKAFSDILVDDK